MRLLILFIFFNLHELTLWLAYIYIYMHKLIFLFVFFLNLHDFQFLNYIARFLTRIFFFLLFFKESRLLWTFSNAHAPEESKLKFFRKILDHLPLTGTHILKGKAPSCHSEFGKMLR